MENLLANLNRTRKYRLFLLVLFIILASIIGAGGFASIITFAIIDLEMEWIRIVGLVVGGLCFLAGTPIFCILAVYQPIWYKRLVYQTFVPDILNKLYPSSSFVPKLKPNTPIWKYYKTKRRMDPKLVQGLTFNAFYPDFLLSTFSYETQGLTGGRKTALAVDEENSRNKYSHRVNKMEYKARQGRYMYFSLNKVNEVEALILHKKSLRLFKKPKDYGTFYGESELFNRLYDTYYLGDKEKAYELLDPDLQAGIINIDEEYGGRLSIYIHEKEIHAYFDFYDSGLRIGLGRKLTEKSLDYLKYELSLPLKVIKALSLQ